MNNNVQTLAKAAKDLMLKEPFYGLLLMSLNKIWDENLKCNGHGTAGVGLNGINYELRIHPEFWENLPVNHKVGILKHELLHIGFFHLTDYERYKDKELLNIAMDIEINQYIDREWLPEHGCFLEDFEEIKLDKKKGTIYYYEKLLKEKDKNSAVMKAIMDALANGEESCKLPNGNTMELPKHDWKVLEGMDEATKELLKSQTKHIIEQVADQVTKSQGVVPGEFEEILKKLQNIEPPKFDWKGYMRRFAGKSVKTYTKKSRRKYNKRLPDNPGLKIKRQKHILAAIDTSRSVVTSELKEFLNELHHMKKTGSEVTIIQCDTAISHIAKFDPRKDLEIYGRGGTSFQPVIDYYNEKEREYSCLFYFTDGEASAPRNARGSILWVLSSKSKMNNKLPGRVIKLEM